MSAALGVFDAEVEGTLWAGRLILGNGVTVGLMDPFDPDSDGGGIEDGAEIVIVSVPNRMIRSRWCSCSRTC